MVRPLKRAASGFLRRPLDAIFGAPSHVALLRALAHAGSGLTGRQVAREAGVAQQAVLEGLARLERSGIVTKIAAGRAYLFRLQRERLVVREGLLPLLEAEGGLRSRLLERLRTAFRGRALSGVVFGSAARGQEQPGSDLDVCLVVGRESDKDDARRRGDDLSRSLQRDLGVGLSLLVFTRREFLRAMRSRNPFHQTVVREGETFTGRSLKAVVHG